MLFLFFKKPILSKKRKSALDQFRQHAVSALEELRKEAADNLSREIYASMIGNVERTPIHFYPSRNLRERIFAARGRIFGSVVKGEHVNQIRIFQQGSRVWAVKSDFINLPAEHIFDGDKLTISGIFTLAHEYAHFPKPALQQFAVHNKMDYEQAEELLADVLSAKLAVKMGYPKENVLQQFAGREIVYGRVPFRAFILKAVGK